MAVPPSPAPPSPVRFGLFQLDLRSGELRKAGLRIGLQEQSLQALTLLLERPGDLVTREQLRQRLWPGGTFVDFDHGVNAVIHRLRDALGDSAETPRFIETIPRRGYRFIAPVDTGVTDRNVQLEPGGESRPMGTVAGQPGSAARARGQHVAILTWPAVLVALTISAAVPFYVLRLWSSRGAPARAMPMTSLPGQKHDPSFSPDGSQIVFVWDGVNGDNDDIYIKVIGAGGGPRRLTTNPAPDRNPVWSPDGRDIAFARSSNERIEIFVTPAPGGPERKIASLDPTLEMTAGPSWSPNGRLLALADKAGPQATPSIFVVSIENLERRRLTSPPGEALGDSGPAISPDGHSVAFNRISPAGGLYVVSMNGGEPRRLTLEPDWRVERLAWTPNGRELVFSSSGGAPGTGSSLWRVSASGGTPERLAFAGEDAANPAMSLRGDRLAYEQRSYDANIWKLEVPTSAHPGRPPAKWIASSRSEAGPQVSPDGSKIAFQSDRTGSFEIWICEAAGSNLVQLTSFDGPVVGAPRWSPDGRHIAFDVLAKGQSDIYVLDVDGGLPRRVTSGTSEESVPSWSKDGRWIYFASNRTGRLEVWKLPAAGGPAVQVTTRGGFAPFESNDGKFVYYTKGIDIDGLWRVAVNGREEAPVMEFPKAGFWGYWALADKGIYFVNTDAAARPALQFLNFAGAPVEHVAGLNGRPIRFEPGLAVSPDGRWILYTQEDHSSSEIMLVENFH